MNRHRAAGTLVLLASACTVGRTSSGDPAASRAVAAAMEHYTALIKAVASDSIAAMYTEDGDDGKVVVDSAFTVSDAHSPAAAASAVVRPVTHRGDHRSSTRGSNRLHDG